jgi:hypothetical protein
MIANFKQRQGQQQLSALGSLSIYPETWADIELMLDNYLMVFEVIPGTEEHTMVASEFNKTMNSFKVVKIERIQNRQLYSFFHQEKINMQERYGQEVEIRHLYHGTRGTKPSDIFTSDEGFDMRFANNGYYGRANYFAEKASYSHGYTHAV